MPEFSADIDFVLSQIQENKSVFLPTESSYIQTSQNSNSLDFIKKLNQIPLFLASDLNQVLDFIEPIKPEIKNAIELLIPGPVEFIFKSNGKLISHPTFSVLFTQNKFTQQLLQIYKNLLPVCYPQFNLNILLTNESILNNHIDTQCTVLKNESSFTGCLPTQIDIANENQILIKRPGIIEFNEIRKVLPDNISLIKDYQQLPINDTYPLEIELSKDFTPHNSADITLVLGTKEKLKETFGLGFLSYFQLKQINNYILINLGSQTNMENIAKNLSKNLNEVARLGISKCVLLDQNWGKNKWRDILQFNLANLTTREWIKANSENDIKRLHVQVSIDRYA